MHSQADPATSDRTFPLFKLPPPMMFGVAFALGATVHSFLPLPDQSLGRSAFLAGVVFLVIGVSMAASLAISFLVCRTTLNPFAEPAQFMARGPYRISRNPMYLTLVITYLGGALMLGSVWPLLALLGPVVILSRIVIPFEEARMLSRFGDDYRDYRGRVRRWL